MPNTDPSAIRFSNTRIRVAADRLAQAYFRAKATRDRWTGLGGGQATLDVMSAQLRATADHMTALYEFVYTTEKLWFLLGGTAFIANSSDTIVDGSPGDGRPQATGEKAVRIIDRCIQYQNWLLSLTGSFTDSTRAQVSYYNTVAAASNEAKTTLTVGEAGNFINRCGELCDRYQLNSNQELSFILAYAVNPTSGT